MSKKEMTILLGVSLVQGNETIPPGKTVKLPVKEAEKMIADGHAVDPSKVVDVESLENEALAKAKEKIADLNKAIKDEQAAKADAENRATAAEKGIQSLVEAVLSFDAGSNTLKDDVLAVQKELKAATDA